MGTSNFTSPMNVNAYYVIGLNEEYEGDIIDFDIDCFKESTFDLIEETIVKDLNTQGFIVKVLACNESTCDRNYPSSYFANITFKKPYSNADLEINILVGYTSGYYEGATLDFKYIDTYGNTLDKEELIDDVMDTFTYQGNYNNGWLVRMRPVLLTTIDKLCVKIEEYFDNLFTKVSQQQLNRVGGFSDGTSIYEPVK